MEENIPVQQSPTAQENPVKVEIENTPVEVITKTPMKIGLGLILGFIFGFLAMIYGIQFLVSGKFLSGFLTLIAGIVVFPLFPYAIKTFFNFELSGSLKWFLFIVLLFIAIPLSVAR
jgi:hypothetical protein